MADATIHIGKVERTYIVPVQEDRGGILYSAVCLYGLHSSDSLHVSTLDPRAIERGRMVVASLSAAIDGLEHAIRRKNAVPIESLAPDPVNIDDLASTELRRADVMRGQRMVSNG